MSMSSCSTSAIGVSAVVLTYNEELNIESCLRSVASWCREVIVVDSGSTDSTVEICRRYTDHIYTHAYSDHSTQWDWALKSIPLKTEWVIPLDADHVITEELRDQIIGVVSNAESAGNAYYARHEYYFKETRMRGFKSRTICVFRRSKTRLDRSEYVDFRFVVDGNVGFLTGTLQEINRKEWSIDAWVDKHLKFSTRMAAEEILRRSGCLKWSISPRLGGNPDERIIWLKRLWSRLPLYVRPFLYFAYRYFLRLGFLDGLNGFLYHFLQAFWFRLMVDIKISEFRQQLANGALSLEQLEASFRGKP